MRWLSLILPFLLLACAAPVEHSEIALASRPSLKVQRIWLLDGIDQDRAPGTSAGLRAWWPEAARQCGVSGDGDLVDPATLNGAPYEAMRVFRPDLIIRLQLVRGGMTFNRLIQDVRGTVTTFPDGLVADLSWQHDGPGRDSPELGRRLAEALMERLVEARLLPGCDLLRYTPPRL